MDDLALDQVLVTHFTIFTSLPQSVYDKYLDSAQKSTAQLSFD